MTDELKRYHVNYTYMIYIFTHYGSGEVRARNQDEALQKARAAYSGNDHTVQLIS